jgi:hypothetical protein
VIALSHPAIFDFIDTYSKCDGCNTPIFSTNIGIGKCIEYEIVEKNFMVEVNFWISKICDFRYGSPEQVRISILVDGQKWQIIQVNPSLEYIENPSFCVKDEDCKCLSGSGVPLIGSCNYFYAPLSLSGFYEGELCQCVKNKCSSD